MSLNTCLAKDFGLWQLKTRPYYWDPTLNSILIFPKIVLSYSILLNSHIIKMQIQNLIKLNDVQNALSLPLKTTKTSKRPQLIFPVANKTF